MADTPGLRLDDFGTPPSLRSDRAVLLARLQDAARSQSTIHCVYFGGSKAGVELDIIPIKIDPPDVWAYCVASGRRKRFRFGLIYILGLGEDRRWARPLDDRSVAVRPPTRTKARDVRTLSQLIEEHGERLDALGWRVTLSERAVTLQRITEEAGDVVVALRARDDGHWAVESLDKRLIKRRRLGAAAGIFLAAAERNARRVPGKPRGPARRAYSWTILRFIGAAVCALLLGAIVGVLLPR
jgi:hypothetical protein